MSRALRGVRDRLILPEATSGVQQWQRVALIAAVNRYIEQLGPSELSAAEISGADHAAKPWKRFASLNYPDFDLCAPLTGRSQFDVVICEQVIEHVVDPWAAVENLRGLCTPGGHVIVSTPFLIRVHELPAYGMRDYWRFTPRGLRTLLERAGLEVDEVGSWGNRSCVAGNLDHWPAYRRWHSLRNEADIPVQVWAFARKPV
ncbi:MAG: class I SAM-dependent methyltransferase [Solirubrobacteraceae bacterium]